MGDKSKTFREMIVDQVLAKHAEETAARQTAVDAALGAPGTSKRRQYKQGEVFQIGNRDAWIVEAISRNVDGEEVSTWTTVNAGQGTFMHHTKMEYALLYMLALSQHSDGVPATSAAYFAARVLDIRPE